MYTAIEITFENLSQEIIHHSLFEDEENMRRLMEKKST